MDKLDLNQLMRYGLAGGVALFSIALAYPVDVARTFVESAWIGATTISALAFIIGALFYALHRAFLFPLLYRLLVLILFCLGRVKWSVSLLVPFWPTQTEVAMDRGRHSKRQQSTQFSTSEWAAQVHFLYCSSWAILTSLWICCYAGWNEQPVAYHGLKILGIIIAIGGFLHNARLMLHESTPES